MRRTIATVASTAVGLGAVLVLHHPRAPVVLGGAAPPRPHARPAASGPPPSTTPGAVSQASGSTVPYGYGQLAVKVTVRGHRILDVAVSSIQTAESYSQMLAQQVIPMLKREVLQAQSAHVNVISGATYTSEAYLSSLQSALDSVHL